MTRYFLRVLDFGVSVVFAALCIKAFLILFYRDLKLQR
jgi:hypothetical protein